MTPQGIAQLKEDEGCELTAYPDPVSKGDPWTCGVGHTGPDVHQGLTVDQAQADAWFSADVTKAETGLAAGLPWLSTLSDFRQDVLTNMAFNLGVHGVMNFHNMLAAMQVQDWPTASAEMLNSLWAKQVQGRAYRLADVMERGYT